jgi:serine/threonine protein kinase
MTNALPPDDPPLRPEPTRPTPPLAAGVTIGPGLRVVARVSQGRFCDVWRGVAPDGREVALKVATSELGARMLRAEGALGGRLDGCPGIVSVRLLPGLDPPVAVMPWSGERTLRDALREAGSGDDRARLFAMLARISTVVAVVHQEDVIHGDLKPENVLIGADGAPRLSDFGLGREAWRERLDGRLSRSMATTDAGGLTGGTLAYLAPEAVKGAEPSRKGDVFALGVMLHEVLLGRRPDKVVDREDLRRELSDDETDVLLGALAFRPDDRPDAHDLSRSLYALLPELGTTGLRRALRSARRVLVRGLAALAVAFRFAAVALLLGSYLALLVGALREPALLFVLLPFAMLHIVVRWEGPETDVEAALRRAGQVAARDR